MNTASRLLLILWLAAALIWPTGPVAAQEGSTEESPVEVRGSILLRPPQIDSFPEIRLHIDAYDAQGHFLPGLKAADVLVNENGQTLPVQRVEPVQNGVQVILVWNAGTTLGVQTDGLTEFERIRQAMQTWASAQPATAPDLFNLATPGGMALVGGETPQELSEALADLAPDLATGQPSLTSLAEALDLATDPLDDPLMKRVILYVTPPVSGISPENFADLSGRAREAGVRVHVWQVGPAVDPGVIQPLEQFALDTGGQFFPIAPIDALPEIEPLFTPARVMYQVAYQSAIRMEGSHRLSVQATIEGSSVVSNEQTFNLTVSPPNPIFLDPPAAVERAWTATGEAGSKPALSPDQVALTVLLEFPDQHPRAIASTRLYVDGALVAENTAEPFDRFVWDIGNETATTPHKLRVEAVDALGMTGTSVEIPIDIVVEQPAQTNLSSRISSQGIIAIAAMVVSGSALAVVLALTSAQRKGRWKRRRPDKKWLNDPLTQPVPVAPLPARKIKTKPISEALSSEPEPVSRPAAAWPRNGNGIAPARLVVLDEKEEPVTGGLILLARQEITFGSDPQRATQVLASPTVDGLHARLYRTDDDQFMLADQNSVAGTWINYAPINGKGARLEHGDLVHIGKVIFRFELVDPSQAAAPQITVTELERMP